MFPGWPGGCLPYPPSKNQAVWIIPGRRDKIADLSRKRRMLWATAPVLEDGAIRDWGLPGTPGPGVLERPPIVCHEWAVTQFRRAPKIRRSVKQRVVPSMSVPDDCMLVWVRPSIPAHQHGRCIQYSIKFDLRFGRLTLFEVICRVLTQGG